MQETADRMPLIHTRGQDSSSIVVPWLPAEVPWDLRQRWISSVGEDTSEYVLGAMGLGVRSVAHLMAMVDPSFSSLETIPAVHRFGVIRDISRGGFSWYVNETHAFPKYRLPLVKAEGVLDADREISSMFNSFFSRTAFRPNNFILGLYTQEAESRPVFSREFIEKLKFENKNIDYGRLFFFVFQNLKTDSVDAALSIFDGTHYPLDEAQSKLPVEEKNPNAKIDRGASGTEQVFEFRRLGKLKRGSLTSFSTILSVAAQHIQDMRLSRARFYAHTDAAGAQLYLKLGFTLEQGPEELGVAGHYLLMSTGKNILERSSISDLYTSFRIAVNELPKPQRVAGFLFDLNEQKKFERILNERCGSLLKRKGIAP